MLLRGNFPSSLHSLLLCVHRHTSRRRIFLPTPSKLTSKVAAVFNEILFPKALPLAHKRSSQVHLGVQPILSIQVYLVGDIGKCR